MDKSEEPSEKASSRKRSLSEPTSEPVRCHILAATLANVSKTIFIRNSGSVKPGDATAVDARECATDLHYEERKRKSNKPHPMDMLNNAVEDMRAVLLKSSEVTVYCDQGLTRSATLAGCYLIKVMSLSAQQAVGRLGDAYLGAMPLDRKGKIESWLVAFEARKFVGGRSGTGGGSAAADAATH